MGRRERDLTPDQGPLARFAHDLRELRHQAGTPSYRELARRANYSASSLSTAARGHNLPTLAVTLAFVDACGGSVPEWERRWYVVAAATRGRTRPGTAAPVPPAGPAPPPQPQADRRWERRRRWLMIAAAAVGTAGGLWALVMPVRARTGQHQAPQVDRRPGPPRNT